MRVFHRYLIYVTRDVNGRAKYPGSVRLCNNEGRTLRVRLRYGGPFTRTNLENYITYIALISNDIMVSNKSVESKMFQLNPGECMSFDVEYEVSSELMDALDFVKLKMISDGLLSIGGFQFDVVTES
ncbi:hypothetical protein [Vulcanisaeta souniana]|nr:hypothetical protein [Vulcanisaeta souniana]GGI81847.1 hypothetical protein GCM10007112_18240 [Vulcanisaeta souniana JCM 11219]